MAAKKTLLAPPKESTKGGTLIDVVAVKAGYRLIFSDSTIVFMPTNCWNYHSSKFPEGLIEGMKLNAGWQDGQFNIEPA